MKTSFIATVFNEEKSIELFLDSIISQKRKPTQVVIVDGGSTDKTFEILKNYKSKFSQAKINYQFYRKKGNRSVGRNYAVQKSSHEIIACSDAGNTLDKNWLENITKPLSKNDVQVVAGYYKGKATNTFEKCLVPYVLVMPDKLNKLDFLPATRSIAFRKSTWKKIGKFNENLSHNEDFEFANRIKNNNIKIEFVKKAIVFWRPRNNFRQAFWMFYRFALGDIEARIIRPKVIFIFLRYFILFYLLSFLIINSSFNLLLLITFLSISYIVWSIHKNYKYVNDSKAFVLLPALQLCSDFAVLLGTAKGLLVQFYLSVLKTLKDRMLIVIIFIYAFLVLVQINWGIPNISHPFAYNMDEWHGLQSIRSVFSNGTSNIEGAGYGSIFFYFTTGLYLVPFILLNIINPFAIKSAVTNLEAQRDLFLVLRANTLIYGVLTILILHKILKDFFLKSNTFGVVLFIFTPIWILLSSYFKYDIAVTFWICLSLLFYLKLIKNATFSNLLLTAIISAFAVAIKISALPLILLFAFVSLAFFVRGGINFKELMGGVFACGITLIIFGFTDVTYNVSAYYDLLYLNLVTIPQQESFYNLPYHPWIFLLIKEYPAMFGYPLWICFGLSLLFWIGKLAKLRFESVERYKYELLVFLGFVFFLVSLVPLKLAAGGNRAVVLLPFVVIITAFSINKFAIQRNSTLAKILIAALLFVQITQTLAWLSVKLLPDPRAISSHWMRENIQKEQEIGIENIPIYQMIPDVTVKEFYFKEYGLEHVPEYHYKVLGFEPLEKPNFLVVSNTDAINYFKNSLEESILKRTAEEYNLVQKFKPNFTFLSFFVDELTFMLSNIVNSPLDITIYERKSSIYSSSQ